MPSLLPLLTPLSNPTQAGYGALLPPAVIPSVPTDETGLLAWWKAPLLVYDATSGGNAVTTQGASISRWESQTGTRHLTQTSFRPVLDVTGGLVACAINSGDDRYFNVTSMSIDRRNFSAWFIVDLTSLRRPSRSGGAPNQDYKFVLRTGNDLCNFYLNGTTGKLGLYNGTTLVDSSVKPFTSRCVVGINASASGVNLYVDGTASTTLTALTAGTSTVSSLFGASTNVFPLQASIVDGMVYDHTLTTDAINNIVLNYANSRGVPSAPSKQVFFVGDSLTQGVASTANRGWVQQLTLNNSVRQRNVALAYELASDVVSNLATWVTDNKINGQTNVCCVWVGTNDLINGVSTATLQSNITTIVNALNTAGITPLVFTALPRTGMSAGAETNRGTFNTWLQSTYSDSVVDVAGIANLSDFNNTTYYADGTHLTTAGYGLVAELAQPAIVEALG